MAGTPGVKPAVKAVTYRNAGTYASPTWTALPLIMDENFGKPWDFADAFTRQSRVKMYGPTQVDFQITAKIRCDDVDAGYAALETAAVSGATLDLLILDGPLTAEGARGARASFHVSHTGQDQAIGNNLYSEYEFKPGYAYNSGVLQTPTAVVVGASSTITETNPG